MLKSGAPTVDPVVLKTVMQKAIRMGLSPLFKIHEVKNVEKLPRTASNGIMRRVLKEEYMTLQKTGKT